MPLYSYRCEECAEFYDIRHGFHEDTNHVCNKCEGKLNKYYGHVVVAASCMPTRSITDFKATKAKYDNQCADMPAYKRLVQDGIQPPQIDGSAHLEKHGNSKLEIESGHVLTPGVFKKENARLQEALGPG